jgi:hypothetical protein
MESPNVEVQGRGHSTLGYLSPVQFEQRLMG